MSRPPRLPSVVWFRSFLHNSTRPVLTGGPRFHNLQAALPQIGHSMKIKFLKDWGVFKRGDTAVSPDQMTNHIAARLVRDRFAVEVVPTKNKRIKESAVETKG